MKRAAAGSVGSCGAGGEPLPRSHVGERGPQARDTDTKRITTAIQPSNASEHADGRARRRSLLISIRQGATLCAAKRDSRVLFPAKRPVPRAASLFRAAASHCRRASLVLAGGEERLPPPKCGTTARQREATGCGATQTS